MEKVFIRLYKRKKTDTENLKVTINYHRARYHTRYNVDEKFFDKESQLILGGAPSYRTINNVLANMVERIETRIAHAPMTEKQFLEFCKAEFEGKGTPNRVFIDYMDEFISTKTAPKTIATYKHTRSLISEYQEDVTFDSMNLKWLLGFEKWMTKRGFMTNGRSIHLRNIRAVFNYCIDNEYTQVYPFRRFSIKTEETRKLALSARQMREIASVECNDVQRKYVDAFMLMFYLLGINASDLFSLKRTDVSEGYLTYRRKKTGKLYCIYIEKEARVLIERYKGKKLLLSWPEEGKSANWFMHDMTKNFEKIFGSHITSNSARHTWATIATTLGIQKDIISAALGHTDGSKTTEIYIKREVQDKIDAANRKVIDYINIHDEL